MALLLKTDGTQTEVKPKNGKDFSLEELHKLVADPIDMVRLFDGYMVVDDEGLLKNLPVNSLATILYQSIYDTSDPIVGDVLICKGKEVK